jgi:putative ABC transport system permease protein
MIGHLFKLVWNRKKTQALIMLEIFLAFVVVFALLASGIHFSTLYSKPLGFEYDDVWVIDVDRESRRWGWEPEEASRFRRLRNELSTMDPVIHVASSTNHPFSGSQDVWSWEQDGRTIRTETMQASVAFRDTMGLQLVAGRWFDPTDEALDWEPVVIDQNLSRQLFGDEDPLNRTVGEPEADVERRVVGVVNAFRRGGHFDVERSVMFMTAREESDDGVPTVILTVKIAPNTPAQFEQEMVERLQAGAPEWTFSVLTLADARQSSLQSRLIPLAIFGTVGMFLLIMVVLGLTGVMWQNVTRRTREIGLRRAAGASRASVHRQIVLEVMITAVFGVGIGAAIAMQIPFVGPFTFLPVATAVQAVIVSAIAILLLAGMCGLYPGWSATRIFPAEALHYE